MSTGAYNTWYCIAAAYRSSEPAAYIISPDLVAGGTYLESTTSFGNVASAAGRNLRIRGFNGFIREIKIFGVSLNSGNAMRIYKQQLSSSTFWRNHLLSYFKLDESVGLEVRDFMRDVTVALNDMGGTVVLPTWAEPFKNAKLVICEGDSVYSSLGYCQSRERFTKIPSNLISMTVNS